MNEANAPVLCLLWGKVKVATEVENSAKGKGNEASLPPESYKIPTADELSELIHVDNSLDELRDLTTMQLAERQEESLKKMHIRNILLSEERRNRLRDFQQSDPQHHLRHLSNENQRHPYFEERENDILESIVIDPKKFIDGLLS